MNPLTIVSDLSKRLGALKTRQTRMTRNTTELHADLGSLRADIVAKRKELASTEAAPLPLEEVAPINADAVRDCGAVYLKEHGGSFLRERGLCAPGARGSRRPPWGVNDPIPWGAWCVSDPAEAARFLDGLVRALGYVPGLPSAERPAEIARLRGELAQLEEAEEEAVDAMQAQGIAVAHRVEVAQRREREAEAQRRAEAAAADRQRREQGVDGWLRKPSPRAMRSSYLQRANAPIE
jgi:hypothetical protein